MVLHNNQETSRLGPWPRFEEYPSKRAKRVEKLHSSETSADNRRSRGFAALVAIVIVAALILAAGISASFVAQTQIIISGHVDREQLVRETLSACVEEALHRLKLNAGYTGGTVALGARSCTVAVSGAGTTRTLAVTAVDGSYSQTVTVDALLKQNSSGKAKGWSITNWVESVP